MLYTLPIWIVALATTLVWFHSGLQVTHEEMGFFFAHPERWLYQVTHLWWDSEATGFANSQVIAFIPFQFAMLILQTLGVSDVVREAMVLFFLLAMSGVSMYLLTRSFVRGSLAHVTSLAAGLIYMFNPYALYLWTRFDSSIFSYPFLPLFAFFFVRGIRAKKDLLKNALFADLSLAFVLGALSNPYYFATYVIVGLSLFLSFLLIHRDIKIQLRATKFALTTLFLGLALYAWWLLPLAYYSKTAYQTATVAINPLNTLLELSSGHYLPIYVMRLFEGFTFSQFVSSSLLSTITILLPVVAFGAAMFRRDKYTAFFGLVSLFGLFLSVGDNPPLGNVFLALFRNLPFAGGFRAPYDKFGSLVALGFSYLVGITVGSIYTKRERAIADQKPSNAPFWHKREVGVPVKAAFCVALVVLAILPSALPMISGSLWNPYLTGDPVKTKSAYVQVPGYYSSASDWLASQGQSFRVISLPISSVDSFVYDWQNGYGGLYPWSLWPQAQIAGRTWKPLIDNVTTQIEPSFGSGNRFYKVMEILGAKYVMVNKDFQLDESNIPTNPNQYVSYLEGQGAPDFSKATSLPMNLSLWQAAQSPAHQITQDNTTAIGEGPSVKVTSLIKGDANWEGGVQYTWPEALNLSNYTYASFWDKFSALGSVNRVYFEIFDSSGNYKKWEITNSVATVWNKITISLNSRAVWQSATDLDPSSIKTIQITIEKTLGTMQPTDWWIGAFEAVPMGTVPLENILQSETFGNLVFFKIQDSYFLPIVHASAEYALTPNARTMFQALEDSSVDPRNTTIFLSSQLSGSDSSFLRGLNTSSYQIPQLSFSRIDPTEYEVRVTNAMTPFFLDLSATYDNNWFGYYGQPGFGLLYSHPASGLHHIIANGYSNSWYIDRTGTYVITLYFQPQNILYAGSAISIVTLIVCVTFVARKRLTLAIRFVGNKVNTRDRTKRIAIGIVPSGVERTLEDHLS